MSLDVMYELDGQQFTWDKEKGENNYKKHNVTFEEAATVILDPDTELYNDLEHSNNEARFKSIGFSIKSRVLIVCHCERENGEVVRIISARKADSYERKVFMEGLS